jgi:hypothetical protein
MSGKYVPPHLRGKALRPRTPPRRGVHFPSNATGNESQNVRYKSAASRFRNENELRSVKYARLSRALATRKIRNRPIKSAMKRGTMKRQVKTL